MDNAPKVKKKRVLPQWMLEPEKSKSKPIEKFFTPMEKIETVCKLKKQNW